MNRQIQYGGKRYPVKHISYHKKGETASKAVESMVAASELNDALHKDIKGGSKIVKLEAIKVSNAISFSLPAGELKDTTNEFVRGLLTRDYADFIFVRVW